MGDWTVHLEFEDGSSNKFWRARVEDKTLYVNYGKIGATGQTQVKDLASPEVAKKEYDKLVAEKRRKGYLDAGSGGGGADEGGDEDEGEEEAPKAKAVKAVTAAAPSAAPAPSSGGHRMVLDAGNRKIEAHLYLDGKTVRMDSTETYANPEAAKKAFDRLKKTLAGEGYKD